MGTADENVKVVKRAVEYINRREFTELPVSFPPSPPRPGCTLDGVVPDVGDFVANCGAPHAHRLMMSSGRVTASRIRIEGRTRRID
jgi:hypothetical protein